MHIEKTGSRRAHALALARAALLEDSPSSMATHLAAMGSMDLFALGLKQSLVAHEQAVGIALGILRARNETARNVINSLGR